MKSCPLTENPDGSIEDQKPPFYWTFGACASRFGSVICYNQIACLEAVSRLISIFDCVFKLIDSKMDAVMKSDCNLVFECHCSSPLLD